MRMLRVIRGSDLVCSVISFKRYGRGATDTFELDQMLSNVHSMRGDIEEPSDLELSAVVPGASSHTSSYQNAYALRKPVWYVP